MATNDEMTEGARELIEESRKWATSALPPSPWADNHIAVRLADALEAMLKPSQAEVTVDEYLQYQAGWVSSWSADNNNGKPEWTMSSYETPEEASEALYHQTQGHSYRRGPYRRRLVRNYSDAVGAWELFDPKTQESE